MFAAAASAVSSLVTVRQPGASLLPHIDDLRSVSATVAVAVAEAADAEGLGQSQVRRHRPAGAGRDVAAGVPTHSGILRRHSWMSRKTLANWICPGHAYSMRQHHVCRLRSQRRDLQSCDSGGAGPPGLAYDWTRMRIGKRECLSLRHQIPRQRACRRTSRNGPERGKHLMKETSKFARLHSSATICRASAASRHSPPTCWRPSPTAHPQSQCLCGVGQRHYRAATNTRKWSASRSRSRTCRPICARPISSTSATWTSSACSTSLAFSAVRPAVTFWPSCAN